MTQFFVRQDGSYIGAFDVPEEALEDLLPTDAIEVSPAPKDARQIWQFPGWSAAPPPSVEPLTSEELYDMLETKGVIGANDRPRPKPAAAAGKP